MTARKRAAASRTWTTVKTVPATADRAPARSTRDNQQSKVYLAEKMAQHLLLGNYWTQSLTDLQVLDLMEQALNHPGVQSRWGDRNVTVSFPKKGDTGWAIRQTGQINLPPGTRNPLTVLHEIAHLLAPTHKEAFHGPGFVAIYRYLVTLVLGEDPARILDATFTSLGVKSDDALLPAARAGKGHRKEDGVPGLLPGQAEQAAEVLRMAAAAGLFGAAGEQTRTTAFGIARRLISLEKATPVTVKPAARIPDTVTVPVSSLLRANDRDDVAEIVLGAVRKSMGQTTLTSPRPTPAEKRQAAAKKRAQKRKTAPRVKATR
jgi:hypothetical protein